MALQPQQRPDGQLAPAQLVEVVDPRALLVLAGEAAAAQRAVNTRRSYAAVYRQFCAHLDDLHGRAPGAEDLTAPAVRGYRDELEAEGRSPATIAHHLSALRQLADRLDADPAIQRVHADRVAAREPRPLERAEYERLLAMPDRRTTAGKRDLAILVVLGDAGLRRSELAALTYDDIAPVRRHRDPRLRPAVTDRPAEQTEYALHVRRAKRGKARTVRCHAGRWRRCWTGATPARPRRPTGCSCRCRARAPAGRRRCRPTRWGRSSSSTPAARSFPPTGSPPTRCATPSAPCSPNAASPWR